MRYVDLLGVVMGGVVLVWGLLAESRSFDVVNLTTADLTEVWGGEEPPCHKAGTFSCDEEQPVACPTHDCDYNAAGGKVWECHIETGGAEPALKTTLLTHDHNAGGDEGKMDLTDSQEVNCNKYDTCGCNPTGEGNPKCSGDEDYLAVSTKVSEKAYVKQPAGDPCPPDD